MWTHANAEVQFFSCMSFWANLLYLNEGRAHAWGCMRVHAHSVLSAPLSGAVWTTVFWKRTTLPLGVKLINSCCSYNEKQTTFLSQPCYIPRFLWFFFPPPLSSLGILTACVIFTERCWTFLRVSFWENRGKLHFPGFLQIPGGCASLL